MLAPYANDRTIITAGHRGNRKYAAAVARSGQGNL
jgi:hypothetical protein